MEKNIIVLTIEKTVGTDKIEFISGEIVNAGNNNCKLSGPFGSVYGIAIKLENEDAINDVWKKTTKFRKKNAVQTNWKSLGDNYYPLYWGKDKALGSRLFAHTKSQKSTGTIQLNKIKLQDYNIIYGAIQCINMETHEAKIHERYPDILKTSKK
jgi:hypothetical protein